MIGYTYIQELFQTILDSSKVIEGRFYICPKWGSELANPNIDEMLIIGQAKSQKYPAALLMPPPNEGLYQYRNELNSYGHADIYTIKMLFVASATNTGQNQPQQPNSAGESTHTVFMTWHDMDRVAKEFIGILHTQLLSTSGNAQVWDQMLPKITLITDLGPDKVSGVMLSFRLSLFAGCVIEDYPADWQTSIVIPPFIDNHPIHSM